MPRATPRGCTIGGSGGGGKRRGKKLLCVHKPRNEDPRRSGGRFGRHLPLPLQAGRRGGKKRACALLRAGTRQAATRGSAAECLRVWRSGAAAAAALRGRSRELRKPAGHSQSHATEHGHVSPGGCDTRLRALTPAAPPRLEIEKAPPTPEGAENDRTRKGYHNSKLTACTCTHPAIHAIACPYACIL